MLGLRSARRSKRCRELCPRVQIPFYGENDEIVFPFAPTCEHPRVEALLGDFGGVLSCGYEAHARYAAKRAGVRYAQYASEILFPSLMRREGL